MNILIIGGGGLIGSRLASSFLYEGHKVIILDNFVSSIQKDVDKRTTLITGSACSYSILNNVFSTFKPDVLFHLADNILNKEGEYSFTDEADTSVSILSNIIRCINIYGIAHIFLGSSGEVYPSKNNKQISEDVNTGIYSHTGNVKVFSENMLRFFCPPKKIGYTFLRYFQIYGNRRYLNPKFDLVSTLLDVILKKQGMVLIGPRLYIDLLNADGAVSATKAVFDTVAKGTDIEEINIGSGYGIQIVDLYDKIAHFLDEEDLEIIKWKPKQQTRSLIADVSKLKSLGWEHENSLDMDLESLTEFRRSLINVRR
jgi:nucleoside-diphosphate-sugar epimerase